MGCLWMSLREQSTFWFLVLLRTKLFFFLLLDVANSGNMHTQKTCWQAGHWHSDQLVPHSKGGRSKRAMRTAWFTGKTQAMSSLTSALVCVVSLPHWTPWSREMPALGLSCPNCKIRTSDSQLPGTCLRFTAVTCHTLHGGFFFCQKHRSCALWVAEIIKTFFSLPRQLAQSLQLSLGSALLPNI